MTSRTFAPEPSDDLFRPEAISDETRAVNAALAAKLAAITPPPDLATLRTDYAAGRLSLPVSPRSPHARTLTIPGPRGDIGLRILAPADPSGAYLHLHGGGWTAGTNDMWDAPLELIGRESGLAAVSVDYRLAPEDPFPAGLDDSVAAARWLVAHAKAEFGASWLAIGGESAGAHLAAATLLRLRDAGEAEAFRAANLMYGCFDLSLTPSMRRAQATLVLDRPRVEALVEGFRGGVDPRDPALSPLYADLRDLPPALFSVGTLDPLLDDSLFMHARWQAAGNRSTLAIFPGGVHGFHMLEGALAQSANTGVARFLRDALHADGAAHPRR
ncbi:MULTISPECIES: alpha/beta hydrolase [unclassified Phenylobacterium]|uniref:alpha/beta hydrolase n=1 Tax=unclassified Phenylobacterium TaxID=2640670 RepID=UPI00083B4EAB|nr:MULTISPECIES: alpha/beta hydrolase [unclassified Phenylobacterium]